MRNLLVVVFAFFLVGLNAQKFENLAPTPPMGWNSWNKFACDVSESLIMEVADAIVDNGLKDVGYEYVVIDDCWQVGRDSMGFIVADPERFPSGIKALADYVHSKGLKFGIYSCAGTETCAGRPGSRGYEFQDAYMYAQWGVDYLKYDWCSTSDQSAPASYRTMRDALYKAGRPVVFSLCEWGDNQPWDWGKDIGHLWRTTGDIYDCFDCEKNHGTWTAWGVTKILDMQDGLRKYAGPNHWNDPDMLEVGNGGLSDVENRAHFSMWCMLAAPLIAGNDVRSMSKETINVLTNKEAIAINQDTLGVQGFRYIKDNGLETWIKPLVNDEWAVCFLNRDSVERTVTLNWKDIVIVDSLINKEINFKQNVYQLHNIWTDNTMGTTKKQLSESIAPHDVLMLRLKKK